MYRFNTLLTRANIEVVDLDPEIELNGVLVYEGTFPNGFGGLMIHPSIEFNSPACVQLIAHELAHKLLHVIGKQPACLIDLILNPSPRNRALYRGYEIEADHLAAHLLVPAEVRVHYPSPRYPTLEKFAQSLDVPPIVVTRALRTSGYDVRRVQDYLYQLIGQRDFLPRRYRLPLAA